ncbi:MAG TPA: hypothetical protein VM433_15055 [Mycobacteriales bacterium]|nr:hypothetical protein [Mycobacteriales bacterium]
MDRSQRRRPSSPLEDAAGDVEVGVQRTAVVVLHAHALAERLTALPPPDDAAARRDRAERLSRLRGAVAAGQESLRRQAGPR